MKQLPGPWKGAGLWGQELYDVGTSVEQGLSGPLNL